MTRGDHRGVVLVVVCGIAKVNHLHIWIFQGALISFLKTNHKSLYKKTNRQTSSFATCSGYVPGHDYTSHRSLIWWRECSQVWGLCGSTYSHEELEEMSSYVKPGLKRHRDRDREVSLTHIAQLGWSGTPWAWSVWLEMAESYSPSRNRRCWGQAAQRRCRCGRGSQTSPEFAHKTLRAIK